MLELLYEGDAPYKKDEKDAGFDLRVKTVITDNETGFLTVMTGTKVAVPDKHVGLLFARSSLHKKGWMLANGVGVIDSTYRGELIVKLVPIEQACTAKIEAGERIAQLVVVPTAVLTTKRVDELPTSSRGEDGFGSTGSGVDDVPTISASSSECDQELLEILGQHCVAESVERILRIARGLLTVEQVDAFDMLINELTSVPRNRRVA